MSKQLMLICKAFPRKLSTMKPALLIACFTLLMLFQGCGKSVLNQTTEVLNRSLPDEISNNVSIYAYKDQKVDYLLTAAQMERFYDTRQLHAWKVHLVTYDKTGKVKSTITADTTFVDESRNLIQARGNVVYTTSNGIIKSDVINWDRNIDEIYSPTRVTLIRENNVLTGSQLRTNSTLSYAEMDSISAEGIVKPNEINW
ncbi:MAG: LPS export ABC transporter periplasmic protein LptC [Candidatus Cloacimonadaceae bacterium]